MYLNMKQLIYIAFSECYGINIGMFMKQHFIEERQKSTFVPELSLIALTPEGQIVGELALHETDIITDKGNVTQLTLCQSAVLPNYRMRGVMRKLVNYSFDKARELGYGAVFLGGNPALYGRYGFEPSSKYDIFHKEREKWGDEGYMVHILTEGALDGIKGITSYYGG